MLTYVSARLNRVCVCVCVLGYSEVPGIAWYAPLLEPLFFSLLLWRKGGERERKEECSACVCDARAHTLAHTHTHTPLPTHRARRHTKHARGKEVPGRGMMGLGRKGQKHPARTPKPQLSLARGYTHIHTARALSLAHEVCLSQKRSGKYMQHTHACARTCERVKRGTRRREGVCESA